MKTIESLKGNYWNCEKKNANFIYQGYYFGKGNKRDIEIPGKNSIFINKGKACMSQKNERGGFYGKVDIDINKIELI